MLAVAWSVGAPSQKHDHVMLWVSCCLGFFGLLRAAEFIAPLPGKDFDAGVHLSLKDIALDSHSSASLVQVK